MDSLRFRLSAFVAAGALLLAGVAVGLLGALQWQEETGRLEEAVSLAAFQLAETTTGSDPVVSLDIGVRPFALLYGNPPDLLAKTGDVTPEQEELLLDEIWQFTTEDGTTVTADFDDIGIVAAGTACADLSVCDTAIVGAHREPLSGYLIGRWYWFTLPPALVAIGAWLTTRWLVGRSLRPVDRMRAELDDITGTDLDRTVPVPDGSDELTRLGQSMNATIGRLRAAVTANERFVADAAHELRSPITGVRAALEVQSARSGGELLDDSIGELDRAGRLIDDLLALARRQGQPTRSADVDLDDLARQEIATAAARFPELDIGADLAPARVTANPDDLRRIISNLIENACYYGHETIEVSITRTTEQATLVVEDDGPGIPPDKRAAVLERFTRLDDSRSRHTGGSGLGLAIANELAGDLGGAIVIGESSLGGASVCMTMPVQPT